MAFNNMLNTGGQGAPMNMAQAAAVIESQKEQERQAQIQKLLPALLSEIDTADINGSMAKLMQVVDQKNAVALIELKLKGEQENRLQQEAAAQQSVMQNVQQMLAGTTPGQSSAPLSVRNNNPGNIKGADGFRSFASPEEGMQAMRSDLMAKVSGNSKAMAGKFGKDYKPTLRNVISTWAPPSENDTEGYVKFVADKAGLDPDAVLTAGDVDKIIPAMTQMEGGPQAAEYFGNISPAAGQPAGSTPGEMARAGAMMAAAGIDGGNTLLQYANFEQGQQNRQQDKESDSRKTQFGQERDLYNDFSKKTEDYAKVRDAVDNMRTAAQENSGPGDIQMVFAFMKAQDPGSTVREGEQATAKNSAGVPEWVRAKYNSVLTGEMLTPEQRKNFLRLGEANFAKAKRQHDKVKASFQKRAQDYGLDPARVTFDLDLAEPEKPQSASPAGWSIKRVR